MTTTNLPPSEPLSFAQQRLWFLDQLIARPAAYNVPGVFEMRGELDAGVLRRSLGELMRRHEPLRTAFVDVSGRPEQLVLAAEVAGVPLSVRDLSALPPAGRQERVAAIARHQVEQPFDLGQAPLWRAALLRLAPAEHILLLTLHHIVADGWSLPILLGELTQVYAALADGRPSPLAELPIGYAGFARWQRARLTGPRLAGLTGYWRSTLDGAPRTLALPTDRTRPATASHRGDAVEFAMPNDLYAAVRELSRELRASPFIVLLAAFAALLQRYTRQDDLVVGTPTAGRTHVEHEDLVGFFANTLPLRVDLTGDPSFGELVARVRATTLSALDHGELPFERIVEELEPARDLARHPIFQVLFAMTSLPPVWEVPGLRVESLPPVRNRTAKFDLSLMWYEEAGKLNGAAEFTTDLFDRATIERLLTHLMTLTRMAVAGPGVPLSRLSLFEPGDRDRIVARGHGPAQPYPADQTLGELFEAQAGRTPGATALDAGGRQVTYTALNARANQLARHLRGLGVRPDTPVAICLDRTVDLAVSVLAILKAGGAYVPLDPDYPPERLAAMLAQARPLTVLTSTTLAARLSARPRALVLVDTLDVAGNAETDLPALATPDNLGYVLYTSGSTGRPKGVAMSQRALVNLFHWHNCGLISGRRTLQFASMSFDMGSYEMFAAWLSGGTLVMLPGDDRRDVVRLASALAEHRIAKVMLPVPVLHRLAEAVDEETLSKLVLEEIVVAGEQLVITRPVTELLRRLPGARLHNHYGPTETHVITAYPMPADPDAWPAHPPIGRPISNTQVHLVDGDLAPVPAGVPGELYLGGVALARGYLHRPDLTADRFVPDPFGTRGGRLYRTGDLARFRGDGTIEFLGRIDHQVKIRGIRVEPGEVEAALGQHPGVRESAVLARTFAGGDRRLVAYVVGAAELTPEALRGHLKRMLPAAMVPAAFVFLAELPLTPNRKVDRDRLPDPSSATAPGVVAPRTAAERTLAGIWRDVLGIDRVGVNDNFFDLGGHSLLATQIVARGRAAFAIELSLATLFERPTIAELAEAIAIAAALSPVAIPPAPRRPLPSAAPIEETL